MFNKTLLWQKHPLRGLEWDDDNNYIHYIEVKNILRQRVYKCAYIPKGTQL